MPSKRPSAGQPKQSPEVQKVHINREEINNSLNAVEVLIDKYGPKNDKGSLKISLRRIGRLMLASEDKKLLRQFMKRIAEKLRTTPSNQRPVFLRMHFYVWIREVFSESRELLPLLDDVGWCPDSYMRSIEKHFKDVKFGYKTFDG